MTETRHGDWMQTAGGRMFWPLDPRPGETHIDDIAHALSNMCRYAGHCREFYSVAQHSVLVSRAVRPENRLWGLLHDAAEAYVVDVPRPLKPHLPGYAEIEARVAVHVARRFGLPPEMPAEVRRVDQAILGDEARCLMARPPRPWHLPWPPLGIEIEPWGPQTARRVFLQEFRKLTRGAA